MKKITILLLSLILVTFLSSCEKTAQEKILGKWQIESIVNSEEMGEMELNMFNKINADKIENEEFFFSIDNLTIQVPEKAICQWDITEDGDSLTVFYPEDGEHIYEIISVTKDELVWKEDFTDFFHTTTLKKVK